jgi:hypothetical protein
MAKDNGSYMWTRLNQIEQDRWKHLNAIIKPWVAWCSLNKKEQAITPKPYEPIDDEFMEFELICMKLWNIKVS